MLEKLSHAQIEVLAGKPKVKRIAVENFLMSIEKDTPIKEAEGNLRIDAKVYRWNDETVKAIQQGIQQAKQNKKQRVS